MTLNQFSFFATVAKHRSLTKASAELRVSQPSISQQLKQLEGHHGTQLYRRVNKGVEITEAGQLFLRTITPILEQVAQLEGGFKPPAPKSAREVLRVGGTDSVSAELLPSLLAVFRLRHPTAELEMRHPPSPPPNCHKNCRRSNCIINPQLRISERQAVVRPWRGRSY